MTKGQPNATTPQPSPALLFETINSYQKTAAIKAALELRLFAPLANGPATAETVAAQISASLRGVRILCDYLTILGFLTKSGNEYALAAESAPFLNPHSPAYAGGTLEFLLSSDLTQAFEHLTETARKGTTASTGTVAPNHDVWISFARSMGPLMAPAAAGLAALIPMDASRATKLLDISASHGHWGLAFAARNPHAHIVALDWASVLEIARENAARAGVQDRFTTIAGSAFEAALGDNYDVILVPNFLHHFSPEECLCFLRRAHAALRPGGTIAIVEFVPNADRVTPPASAGFGLIMLASTPAGDAYTFAEYSDMLKQSGFNPPIQHSLPASMNVALIANK